MKRTTVQIHDQSNPLPHVSKTSESTEKITVDAAESNRSPQNETYDLVADEVLRNRIRRFIDPPTKRSLLEAITTNPSVAIVLGFILTGIIGGFLSYQYGRQQHELAARRSFSDEINKTRVQKLGEVWEQVDHDEFVINNILEERRLEGSKENSDANKNRIAEITNLIHNDQSIASKNRFWLGEPMFERTMVYLDASIDYAARNIGSKPGADLTELVKKRDAARQDFLRLRSSLLEGEPNPQEQPTR